MPRVGILCSATQLARWSTGRCAYADAIAGAGGEPLLVGPPSTGMVTPAEELGGLLVSGGVDIDPRRYGEAVLNETVEVDLERDAFEIPYLIEALTVGLPILGICRGIQSLNVALGGTLYQDLPTQLPGALPHRQSGERWETTHDIHIVPGTSLSGILGDDAMPVNSLHHQSVRRLANALRLSAEAPDGVIEGAELPGRRFCIAVQFHPEEMVERSDRAARLFAGFLAACRESG